MKIPINYKIFNLFALCGRIFLSFFYKIFGKNYKKNAEISPAVCWQSNLFVALVVVVVVDAWATPTTFFHHFHRVSEWDWENEYFSNEFLEKTAWVANRFQLDIRIFICEKEEEEWFLVARWLTDWLIHRELLWMTTMRGVINLKMP